MLGEDRLGALVLLAAVDGCKHDAVGHEMVRGIAD
jgi:hypothetical protein